eukprot:TRINITY_DN2412_c0_g1_i1.p1 TRINITY_DN2412_c0_g1~~TRINITY_DN2412_c0_g1_i1.p1  ORF type:complete len:428 (-),score=92.24 TRINITY_DN2412_c0_g1_i1:151-1266(-)
MDRQYALAMANEMNGSETQRPTQPSLVSFGGETASPSPPSAPSRTASATDPFFTAIGGGDEQILTVLDRWKASDIFTTVFESKYGSTHPSFNCETARSALLKAKREAKMLMVYLHHPLHDNTDLFCFTLCSPAISEFIDENFILWVGEINISLSQVEGQLAAIGVTAFPFLAVISDLGSGSIGIVDIIQGIMGEDELMVRLLQTVENQSATLEKLRAENAEKEAQLAEQRGLRMEQEMAYNASLVEDMERERQEEEAQLQEAQRISMMDAKRAEKSSKKASLPPEPEKGASGSTHLVIRLPTGTRIERRFMKTDTISTVKDFVDSTINETGFDSDSYSLTSAYPRKTFTNVETSLEEAGLVPQAVLHVSED